MAYTIACQDAGITCPFVAEGETEEEVLQNATKHVKEAHGYTDEQLNDPEFHRHETDVKLIRIEIVFVQKFYFWE